jgi:hypothetical protein
MRESASYTHTFKRGQFKSIQTYISHPWVVTNISDECEVIYMPTPDKEEVIIALRGSVPLPLLPRGCADGTDRRAAGA